MVLVNGASISVYWGWQTMHHMYLRSARRPCRRCILKAKSSTRCAPGCEFLVNRFSFTAILPQRYKENIYANIARSQRRWRQTCWVWLSYKVRDVGLESERRMLVWKSIDCGNADLEILPGRPTTGKGSIEQHWPSSQDNGDPIRFHSFGVSAYQSGCSPETGISENMQPMGAHVNLYSWNFQP